MYPHPPGIYNLSDPDFIAANQRGQISEAQAALLSPQTSKLLRRFQRGSRLNGVVVIVVLVFFLAVQALGVEISTPLVLGAFGLLLVVLAVQIGGRWAKASRESDILAEDLTRGQILSGIGSLQLGKTAYQPVLGDRVLRLPLGSKDGVSPGITYRFYYLPESGVVLSAESLEEEL